MDIKVTLKDKEVKTMFNELLDMGDEMMDDGFPVLKKATPIASGNARRKTVHRRSDKIESKYPYAGRLDEGWSKQAPKGFTDPTLEHMEDFVDKFTRKVQR
jgi:hypothetical protein